MHINITKRSPQYMPTRNPRLTNEIRRDYAYRGERVDEARNSGRTTAIAFAVIGAALANPNCFIKCADHHQAPNPSAQHTLDRNVLARVRKLVERNSLNHFKFFDNTLEVSYELLEF